MKRWLYALVALALAGVYVPMFRQMVHAWMEDTYAGHGMFVPLFSAVIVWIDSTWRFGTISTCTGAFG